MLQLFMLNTIAYRHTDDDTFRRIGPYRPSTSQTDHSSAATVRQRGCYDKLHGKCLPQFAVGLD